MKRTLIVIAILLTSVCSKAQQTVTFPFQGGNAIFTRFFKDSLVVSPEIVQKRATGTVIFKFTADYKGTIKKIIVYYADDYVLTIPLIEALKKSNHKWIIPDDEKLHDFVITFSVNYNQPTNPDPKLGQQIADYYANRKPILSYDQLPIDDATLLPTVVVNYDLQ
jgi:hypothetical protein